VARDAPSQDAEPILEMHGPISAAAVLWGLHGPMVAVVVCGPLDHNLAVRLVVHLLGHLVVCMDLGAAGLLEHPAVCKDLGVADLLQHPVACMDLGEDILPSWLHRSLEAAAHSPEVAVSVGHTCQVRSLEDNDGHPMEVASAHGWVLGPIQCQEVLQSQEGDVQATVVSSAPCWACPTLLVVLVVLVVLVAVPGRREAWLPPAGLLLHATLQEAVSVARHDLEVQAVETWGLF